MRTTATPEPTRADTIDPLPARLYRRGLLYALRCYFGPLRVIGREPAGAATLYLCTHRNGVIDAALVRAAIGANPVPVAASQVTRSLWGRWTGSIEVVRASDRRRHGHRAGSVDPLAVALARLAAGQSLLWFPEGTSDGGPRLLPVRRGAAQLLDAAITRGLAVRVVVIGLHYRSLDALQSDVEVEMTAPKWLQPFVLKRLPAAGRVAVIQTRIVEALRAVSIEYPDADVQSRIEALTADVAMPIAESRRALLRQPALMSAASRCELNLTTPASAWPWTLLAAFCALAWLPTLVLAWRCSRGADRNNRALIRSLVGAAAMPFNAVALVMALAAAGASVLSAIALAAATAVLGLRAWRRRLVVMTRGGRAATRVLPVPSTRSPAA